MAVWPEGSAEAGGPGARIRRLAALPPRDPAPLSSLPPSFLPIRRVGPVGSGAAGGEHGCRRQAARRPPPPLTRAGVASLADEDDDDDDKEEEEAAGSGDATVGFVLF